MFTVPIFLGAVSVTELKIEFSECANTKTMNMTNLVAMENMEKKMSTREIAELTEKRHHNLLRDVKNLIDQGAITERNFALSEYKDAQVKSSNKALSSR